MPNDYDAWDRFGRTLSQWWEDYGSMNDADYVLYTYDYAGNRLVRNLPLTICPADDRDQVYTYDGLQRLMTFERGKLSSPTGISPKKESQDWTLDQLGNWSTFKQDDNGNGTWDLDQDRTHNEVNELETLDVWANPAYDDAGNMTTMPQPQAPASSYTLKYDAWNRLVEVKDGSTVVQANEFDGLNRRIQKVVGTDTYDYYYNNQWQVLEIRKNGDTDPWKQYIYHPNYVDAIAVRFYDSDTDGTGIAAHYYLQDANYNVTAVTDNTGTVVERYAYTPYGEVTFLDVYSANPTTSSAIGNEYLYTGRRRDPETGLQLNRNRFYASNLGRWVNRDPIGYEGGTLNLYEYVGSDPINNRDFSGKFPIAPGPVQLPGGGWYDPISGITFPGSPPGDSYFDPCKGQWWGTGYGNCMSCCMRGSAPPPEVPPTNAVIGFRVFKKYPKPGKPVTKSIWSMKCTRNVTKLTIKGGIWVGRVGGVTTIIEAAYDTYRAYDCHQLCSKSN